MESYHPLKLKRKDLEDVNDDFSDFSISSPARKIRRLDAELPYRIDEEGFDIPIEFEHSPLPEPSGIRIEELPSNDERAIVVFNPSVLPREPSNFSVSVDHRLLSALKNQAPSPNHSVPWRLAGEKGAENGSTSSGNGCLAVVPWVPSSFPEFPSQANSSEMMDVQEVEGEGMDIEDGDMEQRNAVGMSGFHQWQQQHCSIPQPPHNAASSIVWYQ